MDTGSKAASARLLNPSHAQFNGQERVNAEIFTAMEMLGHKLKRAEIARDDLARRLALFESAAAVDEKTGKLYLPVAVNQDAPPPAVFATPKWMVASSMMSSAVALCALGLVLFHEPAPSLTKQQIAALDLLKTPQFSMLQWKPVDEVPPASLASSAPAADAPPPAQELSSVAAVKLIDPVVPAPEAPVVAAAPVLIPVPDKAAVAEVAPVPAPAPALAPEPAVPAPALAEAAEVAAEELPGDTELTQQEQMAELPQPVKAVPEVSVDEVRAEPVKKTVNVEDVLIPGEDKIVEKKEEKIAAPKDVKKPADVAPTVASGDMVPDSTLPEQLAQLEKRAFQGVPEAQHDLATLYASGKMVAQDYKRALHWFGRAADGGVANAHYNLGVIYQQGLSVKPNMTTAISWYEKAAELGHPEAMYNLGIAYIEGIGTKANVDRGIAFFKRAANAGVAQAAYNLGVLYESSFVGAIDTAKAVEWYQVAANQNHAEARAALSRLTGSATPGSDQAMRLANEVEPAAGEEYGEGDSSSVEEDARALASRVQQELVKQGLLPGAAVGTSSPQIEDAIRAYQRKAGLPVDGRPSRSLLQKMRQAAAGN